MKTWTHEVSVEWLQARRRVITATEIANLLPEYKRMKKKPGKLPPGFAALWCEKHTDRDLDTTSIGPAARGHIMEPWAISSYNGNTAVKKFEHWDDCIICNGGVGFSPDACDVSQPVGFPSLDCIGEELKGPNGLWFKAPKSILEVKSYDPKHHMMSVVEGKQDHKELWQLAVAFKVLPNLTDASIVWFCPNAPVPMHVEQYTRKDLESQLETIGEICKMYEDTARRCEEIKSAWHVDITEDQIYMSYLQAIDADEKRDHYLF